MHYCLPPLHRFDLDEVMRLIAQHRYFVLHAPRQTGKTSSLLALQDYLNATGEYRALYVNVEGAQAAREDVELGIASVVQTIARQAYYTLQDDAARSLAEKILTQYSATAALESFLAAWCESQAKPTILLIDEIDSLIGDTLIAVLRQLRSGYAQRPQRFPQSLILCGVRDVRDYRLRTDEGKAMITGGSAFNINAKSLRLGNFTQTEVVTLYQQHTETTGQQFTQEALDLAWHLTNGQPWLVNALAYESCFEMAAGRERTTTISAEMIVAAKETLIRQRVTHLDQLTDKLREGRVRRVIEPMLDGTTDATSATEDDIDYVTDLGLIQRTVHGLQIANPIYQEVIPRALTHVTQLNLESLIQPSPWYLRADGGIDMQKLLTSFQQFFRENAESWLGRFDYQEAAPQLLLQAFLQRIVNGDGAIFREYGLGRRRTDLLIVWPLDRSATPQQPPQQPDGQKQRIVVEVKLLYRSLDATIQLGVTQTKAYMDRCAADEGHLCIFDRSSTKSWDEKIFIREVDGISVWGL